MFQELVKGPRASVLGLLALLQTPLFILEQKEVQQLRVIKIEMNIC